MKKLVGERLDEITELTDEINSNDLIFYFKVNTAGKRFNDFNNSIELLEKDQSGEMKLEEAKKLQNVFKSNIKNISRRETKSERKKSLFQSIKLL